jgi:phosphosulfolactate synthase
MNINLPHIPKRTKKPRKEGLTMMMDKGLSLQEVENFVSCSSEYTDFIKFGFGTSVLSNNLEEKIKIYKEANIKPYFGGTLFEAFIVRNMFDEYRKFVDKYKIELIEVSDGAIHMNHNKKCEYINELSKSYTVISEVGSKEAGILISPNKWISMMKKELKAGSFKVIAEARESGNVGIYRPNGNAHVSLINKIIDQVSAKNIIWETPKKAQQVWFIKLLGANVNLGNIAHNEVIPLETLRLGLRGDTFYDFLPKELKK